MKYQMSTTLGCKDIIKTEFVTKTQFLFKEYNVRIKQTSYVLVQAFVKGSVKVNLSDPTLKKENVACTNHNGPRQSFVR